MKVRNGFVSNSSSCSFTIFNITKTDKTLVDFVKETPYLLDNYRERYAWSKIDKLLTQEDMIASAEARDLTLKPGANVCIFGDEEGDLIGRIYDYILRDGGSSNSFSWRLEKYLR